MVTAMPREYRTPRDIDSDFPGWHAWKGINGAFYGHLLMSSPPVVYIEPTLAALAGQIRKWKTQRYQWLVVPRGGQSSSH